MNISKHLINPVISMEYQLRMRSKKTPWIITLYLLALSGIIFTIIYFNSGMDEYFNPNRSRELFILLSFTQFALISFVTPGLTAGVISGEREKQTLNILLTTNLSPMKIIIGKWFSSLSFMLLLIISSMPIYSIAFLFGGIAPVQLVQVFGIYMISMLAIGSLGVLFSTMIKRTGIATILTYTTIIAYTILTIIIPQIIEASHYGRNIRTSTGHSPQIIDWFYSINPFTGMLHIFEGRQIQNMPMDPYWIFIVFFMIFTIISISLAIYLLKPVRRRFLFLKNKGR